jgi:N-acetylglucosaminyldiphosphoundecaprenol N-acetyl-beta-D-mannosaminyltransferase
MVTADGIGVVLSARLLNLPIFERVSGCDMVAAMCELSARRGYRLFFLGAAPGIAERAVENLRQRYPQMVVAGVHHGYFPPEEEEAIVEMIRRARTDILFVALGIPKQEQFIHRNMERMQAAVCIGVGGSFDVYAGAVKRAPLWMQRLGLEWLYRTACQPRRIGRLWAIPRLLYLTLRHLRQKVNSTPNSSEGKLTV